MFLVIFGCYTLLNTMHEIASVNDSGIVVSKVPGLAEITVSCGNVNSSCQVTVIEQQDSTAVYSLGM